MEKYQFLPSQGFCKGVENAVTKVIELLKNSTTPVYLFSPIVHNQQLNDYLLSLGAIMVEDYQQLLDSSCSGTIVFSAHGTSKKIIKQFQNRSFTVLDTACQFVLHIFKQIKKFIDLDYSIFFIGKKTHPEAIAAKAIDPNQVYVITSELDIPQNITKPVFICNQSTWTKEDSNELVAKIKEVYPKSKYLDYRCYATITRQKEVEAIEEEVDGIIIISDLTSNNGQMLLKIAQKKVGIANAIIVSDYQEIPKDFLDGHTFIALGSSASISIKTVLAIQTFLDNYLTTGKC